VEAKNSSGAELTEAMKQDVLGDTNGCLRDSNVVFGEDASSEVSSCLTFGKLRHHRFHAQELYNQFAHLLNRGSSLE
jgi:hypothetical protein